MCCQFWVADPEQVSLFYRVESGWASAQSTPFTLHTHQSDLAAYIDKYMDIYLREEIGRGSLLGQVLMHAQFEALVCPGTA